MAFISFAATVCKRERLKMVCFIRSLCLLIVPFTVGLKERGHGRSMKRNLKMDYQLLCSENGGKRNFFQNDSRAKELLDNLKLYTRPTLCRKQKQLARKLQIDILTMLSKAWSPALASAMLWMLFHRCLDFSPETKNVITFWQITTRTYTFQVVAHIRICSRYVTVHTQ